MEPTHAAVVIGAGSTSREAHAAASATFRRMIMNESGAYSSHGKSTYRTADGKRNWNGWWIALAAVVALIVIAFATGFFNLDMSGELRAPNVEVSGGEVPDVQLETGEVKVGTEKVTVDVPTVEVTNPGDDGNANR
jgi:hypothetical protein